MTATARLYAPEKSTRLGVADCADTDALSLLGVVDDGVGAFHRVRAGLPTAAVERLAESLSIGQRDLMAVAAIAPATLTRRRQARPALLSPEESDRVYRIAAAYSDALQLFEGDRVAARAWLQGPAKSFGGHTPWEYLSTEVGAAEVHRLIARLEQGVYA